MSLHRVHKWLWLVCYSGDHSRSILPGAKERVLRLYYQLTDIVALLAELVRRQKLTDDVLLQVENLIIGLTLLCVKENILEVAGFYFLNLCPGRLGKLLWSWRKILQNRGKVWYSLLSKFILAVNWNCGIVLLRVLLAARICAQNWNLCHCGYTLQ